MTQVHEIADAAAIAGSQYLSVTMGKLALLLAKLCIEGDTGCTGMIR